MINLIEVLYIFKQTLHSTTKNLECEPRKEENSLDSFAG